MKFVNVFAVIALLAIPDATEAKWAAIQQQVAQKVQQSSIQNSIKSFGIQAPNQIKNFFKTKASAIGQPINSIYKSASQASIAQTSMPYQAVTEQPIGFVQSAKNSIAKGYQKLAQKPIAPQNIAAAQSNIAPQAASGGSIGFQGSTPLTGIQTESAQIKNVAYKPAQAASSIQQPINQNIQQVVGINQPINQAASIQAPQNIASYNAPKASAWASAQNTPLTTQNVINQNLGQNIINKEASQVGIQAVAQQPAEQFVKAPMGFAAI